jgi:hypothetical protein
MSEVANTVTSSSGTASAVTSDTGFKVIYSTPNHRSGVYVYLNYDENGAGTVTVTLDALNPSIHASNLYRLEQVAADGSVAAITWSLSAADGKFRLFAPMSQGETTLQVNVTIQTTTQSGTLAVEFQDA